MGSSSSDKSFIIFGRDVAQIPCFRNSFFYGISGGIVCGLARFMFTSRPKSAADFAMGSFVVVTMTYWFRCRYEYSKTKMDMERMKYLIQQHTIMEGTVADKELKVDADNVPVEV